MCVKVTSVSMTMTRVPSLVQGPALDSAGAGQQRAYIAASIANNYDMD